MPIQLYRSQNKYVKRLGKEGLGGPMDRVELTNLCDGTDGIDISSTSRLHADEREEETEE